MPGGARYRRVRPQPVARGTPRHLAPTRTGCLDNRDPIMGRLFTAPHSRMATRQLPPIIMLAWPSPLPLGHTRTR